MKWLRDGLSVDETKVSLLMFGFLVSLGFAMYQVIIYGDISENLLDLVMYLIISVSGMNIADTLGRVKRNKDASTSMSDTNVNNDVGY